MDSYGDSSALAAAYLIAALMWLVFAVVFYVLGSIFLMKIFEKAGVQGKWRAWVPFYNVMIFLKLGDLSPWLAFGFVLTWVPVLGWLVGIAMTVLMVLAAWRVGLKLQKSGAWVVLYIFLSLVLARHQRVRQVALEPEHRPGIVGGQRLPRRPHRVAGHPGSAVGCPARRLRRSAGLPAPGSAGLRGSAAAGLRTAAAGLPAAGRAAGSAAGLPAAGRAAGPAGRAAGRGSRRTGHASGTSGPARTSGAPGERRAALGVILIGSPRSSDRGLPACPVLTRSGSVEP